MDNNIKIYEKTWGCEKWITNNDFYCGKILCINKWNRCSFHYHKLKKEHFYINFGKIELWYAYHDDFSTSSCKIMLPGDVMFIPQLLRHCFVALEDSEIFEVSTTHFDTDSYRINVNGNK
jgi:mannose-6-phosphate isomerase-like protein (cupin superfamily)